MRIEKPLRRWGNAFGLLISKDEARRLGVHAGDLIDADLAARKVTRPMDLPSMKAGAVDLDDLLARDLHAGD